MTCDVCAPLSREPPRAFACVVAYWGTAADPPTPKKRTAVVWRRIEQPTVRMTVAKDEPRCRLGAGGGGGGERGVI